MLWDELLQASKHQEDPQCQVSDAEIMTVAIAATSYFHGNFENAGALLKMSGAIPKQLSRSQFNRCLHRLKSQFVMLFEILGQTYKQYNQDAKYLIDTFPIPACDNIRIRRSKLYQGEEFRGYTTSKRRYFYGLKNSPDGHQNGATCRMLLHPRLCWRCRRVTNIFISIFMP